MNKDTRAQEATGVRFVQQIIEEHWKSGWQPTSSRNDDGIDGYIHLRRKGHDTGAVLFAQIKCGSGYRSDTQKRPDMVGISVDKLEEHRVRWQKQPVPVVLIFVDPTNNLDMPEAWWTDAKAESSFTVERKNYALLPKTQRFGKHSKGDFYKLCGHRVADQMLQRIELLRSEAIYFPLSEPLKHYARAFYSKWSQSKALDRTNSTLGEVTVNRVGWRHICRKARRPAYIFQSWQLLGAARRIVIEGETITRLGNTEVATTVNGTEVKDYVGLRARVAFPHRHESVVQVVLRRHRVFTRDNVPPKSRTWFYSVYELRRGK